MSSSTDSDLSCGGSPRRVHIGTYTLTLVITDEEGLNRKSKPVVVDVNCNFAKRIGGIIGKACNNKPQIKWQ
jgi:hypothetical protein